MRHDQETDMNQHDTPHHRIRWHDLDIVVIACHVALDKADEVDIARRAKALAAAKTTLGPKPKDKAKQKNRIRSIGTRQAAESLLRMLGRFLHASRLGNLSAVPLGACQLFLLVRAEAGLSQSALKRDKRLLELIYDEELQSVEAKPRKQRPPREVSIEQLSAIAAEQSPDNALASRIAHATGARASELLTLARPDERPPSPRQWHDDLHSGLTDCLPYTVIGKGGLIRTIMVPRDLARELEALRRPQPMRVRDHGRNLLSYYRLPGGDAWASSFRKCAKKVFGASPGAHGTRHGYVAIRKRILQQLGFDKDTIDAILSQELGHRRPEIIDEYYSRGPWQPDAAARHSD
jgi:integrase